MGPRALYFQAQAHGKGKLIIRSTIKVVEFGLMDDKSEKRGLMLKAHLKLRFFVEAHARRSEHF